MAIEINNKSYQREQIWLVSVLFNKERNYPLFCLFISDETDFPMTEGGKILFFRDVDFINLLNNFGLSLSINNIYQELDFVYNINYVIDIIKYKKNEESSYLLDSINILCDITNELNILWPAQYKKRLNDIADYLTFNSDISKFLEGNGISEEDVLECIYWLNGAIFSNCIIKK